MQCPIPQSYCSLDDCKVLCIGPFVLGVNHDVGLLTLSIPADALQLVLVLDGLQVVRGPDTLLHKVGF